MVSLRINYILPDVISSGEARLC